ncbi:hypothetical protein OGAPHI_003970 [Ogataea philodendri]|uniref:Major facilitator superfamily (MFS) profile domain-containing protein n=1 Tax=Ogataea philodendri TaxID=1378263 RepID=A0A9P8P5R5_9ASCO|nr:uncharacterized protein OGAPHI_003970 [Ogataea philodendri]KAH3665782.1 hypothetical protein OGAPHI_003970 [Ogataea philodendri]
MSSHDRESFDSTAQDPEAKPASIYSPAEDGISRTASRVSGIVRKLTHGDDVDEKQDREALERMITNRSAAVSKIVDPYEEGYGALGPLEQPLDHEKTVSGFIPDPTSDFHENDQWKYPIDKETQMRLVVFVDGDKKNPQNWSFSYRWFLTILLGTVCFAVAFASAAVTGDIGGPMESFHVSQEVVILTVSLFVLGFGFGPLAFAPLSEEFGRTVVYLSTLFVAVVFVIPCALAKNIGTLLVCRLIDGLAFSAPMCLIGGSLADLFQVKERGLAMTVFSAAPFIGPALGPLIGGYIGDNVGWRWIYWVILIFSGAVYAAFVVLMPETSHNKILKDRAKKLRKTTGDEKYRALTELKVRTTTQVFEETLLRPLVLLTEVIVFLMTMYMSVIYGLLYMFFFGYPVVYTEGKGWSDSKTGLMFIPIAVGVLAAVAVSPWVNNDYNRRADVYRHKGVVPPAELRLFPMMVGCWFVPAGLFAFAWSSYPRLSWAGPCFSGFACGFGFNILYNSANNYIVDSYQHYAASALAAKTFVRSIWGAAVPLFTIQMYHRLGYEWASSLMAFIALACCAIPFAFFFYGAKVRTWSKYAYSPVVDAPESDSTSEAKA